MLSKYIPTHFSEIYSKVKSKKFVSEKGSVMFADLSGFTKMSEKLTAKGKEGSEEISRIINEVFEDLITIVTAAGGSVYKFGGDAVTVFFPERVSKLNVLITAAGMQEAITKFDKIKSIAGTFSIKMKIGIAYGKSLIGMLGEENKQYFIAGDTLDTACGCEHASEQGEIIVTKEMTEGIPKKYFEKRKEFFKLEDSIFRTGSYYKPSEKTIVSEKDKTWFREYIDEELVTREDSGSIEKGELRNCAVIFLNFSGIDYGAAFDYNLLNEFYTLVAKTTKKYQGFVNKIDMGDKGNKIIMLFGAPVSTEKNEEFALRAVSEIKQNKPSAIDIKIGVNNGNIYFGVVGAEHRREFTVMGNTVNLSARLMASASPNEIIISKTVKERVPEIQTGKERHLKLKGVADLFPAYDLIKVLETRKSKRFKLIGRKNEQEEYKNIIKAKSAVLINIKAEAGLGKSVLVNKFFQERVKENICYLVNCLSYTKNNPYYSVKEFIAKFADISFLDANSVKREKLGKLMKEIDEEQNTDLYSSFLGWKEFEGNLSDPGLKDFFSEITLTIFNKVLTVNKAVLFLEDTHWIDGSSAEFFRSLLNIYEPSEVSGQIHFVFRPDRILEPFVNNKKFHTIELKNLEYEDGREFITEKFNLVSLPAKIYEQIYQKTKGNPFFMEEILLGLKNDGALIPVKGSVKEQKALADNFMSERDKALSMMERSEIQYKIKPSIKSISIPDNVNDIVLARIDKLDENSKTILKIASVIGRIFQFDILKQLQNLREIASQLDIKDSLFDLTKVDLTIFEETSDNEYLFKHAITQEVAYETLLFSLRRKYHLKIAQLYEKRFKDDISNAYELLAYHYGHTNDKEKAKYYLLRSAESAKNKFSFREALDFLKQYRKYKMKDDEKLSSYFIDIEILKISEKRKEAVKLCDMIMKKTGSNERLHQSAYVKKINLLRRNADYAAVVKEYYKIDHFIDNDIELEGLIEAVLSYIYLGEPEKLEKTHKRMEFLTRKTRDGKLKVWSYSVSGIKYQKERDYKKALGYYKKMEKLSEPLNLVNEKFTALRNMASVFAQTGNMEKAEKMYEKVYFEAKKIHNQNLLLRAIDGLSNVSYVKGDFKKAERFIRDGIKIVSRTGKTDVKEMLLQNLYNIKLDSGEFDDALKICCEREELLKKTGNKIKLSELNDNIGDAYFYKKEFKRALSVYQKNLQFSTKIDNIEMVGHSYGNIANCYGEMGLITESIKYYKMQCDYSVRHNDLYSEGKALYNLAYTYIEDLNDIKKASETVKKAKKIFDSIGFKPQAEKVEALIKEIEEKEAESKEL